MNLLNKLTNDKNTPKRTESQKGRDKRLMDASKALRDGKAAASERQAKVANQARQAAHEIGNGISEANLGTEEFNRLKAKAEAERIKREMGMTMGKPSLQTSGNANTRRSGKK